MATLQIFAFGVASPFRNPIIPTTVNANNE